MGIFSVFRSTPTKPRSINDSSELLNSHNDAMSSQRRDVEGQQGSERTGAIRRTSRRHRWPGSTLALLVVHTLLISACLALLFTGYRFGGSSETENPATEQPAIGLLLKLFNKDGGVSADQSNLSRGLLEFIAREAHRVELHNKSVVTVSCGGPYILYPYLPDPPNDKEETFNITVVRRDTDTVLTSILFNTYDKTTWRSQILTLDRTDKISVFVNCSPKCPMVEELYLRLQFMLTGQTCTN